LVLEESGKSLLELLTRRIVENSCEGATKGETASILQSCCTHISQRTDISLHELMCDMKK
jgi:hypothetical protein